MNKLEIRESMGHGKNTKGNKQTSTLQVVEPFEDGGFLIKKQFRFFANDRYSRERAHKRALHYILTHK